MILVLPSESSSDSILLVAGGAAPDGISHTLTEIPNLSKITSRQAATLAKEDFGLTKPGTALIDSCPLSQVEPGRMDPRLYREFYEIEEHFWWSVSTRRIFFRRVEDVCFGLRCRRQLARGTQRTRSALGETTFALRICVAGARISTN